VQAYDLNGKVALVTGAGRGIGLEAARQMHRRGASVALIDLDGAAAQSATGTLGARTLGIGADVRDRAALDAAVAATVERFGGLDVVVANAGVAPEPRPMSAASADAFHAVLDVNIGGVCNTVGAALPQVRARAGQVVVVASVYAFLNGALATPYAMSKAAVEQLGRALRVELAPSGASATVAYYGFVDTRMVRDAFEDPIALKMQKALPRFMTRAISAATAGEALVRGVERRAPRVIAPSWWRVYSALRGILNPLLDARMERDERIQSIIREAGGNVNSDFRLGAKVGSSE
jgi:NAD(P)-dependent dehydrogenase (short-subunit alcohol dehydrogenase family)